MHEYPSTANRFDRTLTSNFTVATQPYRVCSYVIPLHKRDTPETRPESEFPKIYTQPVWNVAQSACAEVAAETEVVVRDMRVFCTRSRLKKNALRTTSNLIVYISLYRPEHSLILFFSKSII